MKKKNLRDSFQKMEKENSLINSSKNGKRVDNMNQNILK